MLCCVQLDIQMNHGQLLWEVNLQWQEWRGLQPQSVGRARLQPILKASERFMQKATQVFPVDLVVCSHAKCWATGKVPAV